MKKPKFSNKFLESANGTWPFEEEYKAILSKPAPKEDFIRIVGASDWDMFYHFQLRTPTQCGYFHLECPMGYIDALWAFLEALCLGRDFASFLTEYEGPNALLCAKEVDKDNLRVTLICDTWLEEAPDHKNFIEKCWPDFEAHASIDVVVNKRHFIYTLYMALVDIFVNDDYCYRICPLTVSSDEEAQVDSDIITKYLGYIPPTDKDKELLKSLVDGSAEDVEKCLKGGANPNAFAPECDYDFKDTILEDFWYVAFDFDCENPDWETFLKKNQLLLDYGAMPRSTFHIFYSAWPLDEEMRLKVFRMFFDKNCFIRYSFWDYVIFDVYNEGATDWLIYEKIVEKGLWSYPPIYACHQKIEYCKPWHQNLEKQCESLRENKNKG